MSNLGGGSDRTLGSDSFHPGIDMVHSNKPYGHLLTPQSPHNPGQYLRDVPNTPESSTPSPRFNPMSTPLRLRRPPTSHSGVARVIIPPPPQQTATPESSPCVRLSSHFNSPIQHAQTIPPYQELSQSHTSFAVGSQCHSRKDEVRAPFNPGDITPPVPSPHISSPTSPSEARSSCLSSPFMEKPSLPHKPDLKESGYSRPASRSQERPPGIIAGVSPKAAPSPAQASQLLPSFPRSPQSSPSPYGRKPGGEILRIRQAMMQDKMAHFQEVESHRPDYLRRAKRSIIEADPVSLYEDDKTRQQDRQREALVGIMESPTKGRRLTLFQETSEESFEESLMAGGYGRYRTAEWVRQPQPMLLSTPGAPGPSNIVSLLERTQEVPPTEKELKKRKRLAAFSRQETEAHTSVLRPVELEGRGRVILDLSGEEEAAVPPESPETKKKAGGRGKKKARETTLREKRLLLESGGDFTEKPNWPDLEFPWCTRRQERSEAASAEAAEKMRWVERFLDRDSDTESEEESPGRKVDEEEGKCDILEDTNKPARRGRGKWVPLPASPNGRPQARRKAFYGTDPADAHAALLSTKSARTLSYRQQRRQRELEDDNYGSDDSEILCLCNGRDDGRQLVQCDGCETWYHLECIGIKNVADLGDADDPWYCRECDEYEPRSLSPGLVPQEPSSEPTFVPTDEAKRPHPSYDPPFYQPASLQDSPMPWSSSSSSILHYVRKASGGEYERDYSSGSPWVDSSSRHQPSTPHHRPQDIRIASKTTPASQELRFPHRRPFEDSPFDPASTPSRGINFGAHFATPKNNPWSTRGTGLFQTPLRVNGGKNSCGNTLSANLEFGGGFSYDKVPHADETPIRRVKSGEGGQLRRFVHSPLTSRSLSTMPNSLFDESPIMRFKEAERRQE